MKAYLAIKYHPDQKNRHAIEQISAALRQNGIQALCITRDLEQWGAISFPPNELMLKSFAEIDSSDLVIIELSEKGVGIGIEAGYAWANNKPIITIAQQGSDISTTLEGISHKLFRYNSFQELAQFFAQLKN